MAVRKSDSRPTYHPFMNSSAIFHMFRRLAFAGLVSIAGVAPALAAETPAAALRKAAVIVENRADAKYNSKVAIFEDFISTAVAGKGVTVLSRDTVTRSLKDYSPTASSANRPGTGLDRLLEDQTSALRLAQNLAADYILVASLTSFGKETKNFRDGAVATQNLIYTLRAGYKLLEAGAGGAAAGNTVVVSRTIRNTAELQVDATEANVLDELLQEAAEKLAALFAKAPLPVVTAAGERVKFTIECGMTDLVGHSLTVPDVRLTPDNQVMVGSNVPVRALSVTVELDGLAIGTTPQEFSALPGLHKLRLSREGFKDWERTVNIYNGMQFQVDLQLSQAGFARWQESIAFLEGLSRQRKLTDAEVEVLKGKAKMLRQSGYKVDMKIDSKDAPTINLNKSIYGVY
jgi:hypothetical protein